MLLAVMPSFACKDGLLCFRMRPLPCKHNTRVVICYTIMAQFGHLFAFANKNWQEMKVLFGKKAGPRAPATPALNGHMTHHQLGLPANCLRSQASCVVTYRALVLLMNMTD